MSSLIKTGSCLCAFLFIFGNSVVFADTSPKPKLDLSGDENKATVFIVRKSRFKASAVKYRTHINDELIGTLKSGSFLKTRLIPGEHDLWLSTLYIRSLHKLDLEKGNKYFIELVANLGGAEVNFVDEKKATAIMKRIVSSANIDSDDS